MRTIEKEPADGWKRTRRHVSLPSEGILGVVAA
jgi:hypothetical protein